MTSWTGKHAIITGGSSGIGLAVATELGRLGTRVSLIARRSGPLTAAVDSLTDAGVPALAAIADVADTDAARTAIQRCEASHGPCDVLVTAAGVSRPGYVDQLGLEDYRRQLETNFFGTLHCIQAVLPGMLDRERGSIMGVASTAAIVGVFGYGPYCASKFAVRGLIESLRPEARRRGVFIGCVYPPEVDTPMLAADQPFKPAETAAIVGTIKPLSADAVARAIVRGLERGRPRVYADAGTRLLGLVAGALPGAVDGYVDRKVLSTARGCRLARRPR